MASTNGISKSSPHHRITLKEVVRDYKAKLLTVKGAIFYAVSSSRKQGEVVRIDPNKFAKQLNVHRCTVYKALAQLQVENRIEVETEGVLLIKIPVNEDTGTPNYIFLEELLPKSDSLLPKSDSLLPKSDSLLPKSNSLLPKSDSLLPKSDKKSPESANDSGSEPLQSLLSIQSLSLFSGERDGEKDQKYREWLKQKALLLPQPPALLERWIEVEAEKGANQREYLKHLETLERASIPAIPQQEENLSQEEYWQRVHQRGNGNG